MKNYTDKHIIVLAKESFSMAQLLDKLGLKPAGGNYKTIRDKIKLLNIDISHFKGQGWRKSLTFPPKRPLEDYFQNKFAIGSDSLRRRLLKEQVFEHKCNNCKLETWMNSKIPLHLHHIDGNHYNNELKNLELLCPNCHALTDNYCGKGIKNTNKQTKKGRPKLTQNICLNCHNSCARSSNLCKSCYKIDKAKKSAKPSKQQLEKDIEELKYFTQIGKKYGVTDNAVRKWCKSYGFNPPNNYHKVTPERVELSVTN